MCDDLLGTACASLKDEERYVSFALSLPLKLYHVMTQDLFNFMGPT